MKTLKMSRIPAVVAGCILLVCIGGYLLAHSISATHRTAQIATLAHAIKSKSEFSGLYLVTNQAASYQLKGKVRTVVDFQSLTNFLSGLSPDVPLELWIEWPDSQLGMGGMTATTVGRAGTYDDISYKLSLASSISFAAFLFTVVFTGFWHLWNKMCSEPKPSRDWFVLIFVPFLGPALIAITWWNSPSKGSNWNPWLVIGSFVLATALFTYCLHSMVKGRYRLLSLLGLLSSGLATVPECLLVVAIIVKPFVK